MKIELQQIINHIKDLYNDAADETAEGVLDTSDHPYSNKFVIVRANGAGVFFGKMIKYDSKNREVFLEECRRLWTWRGFTISYVANNGMADNEAKISEEVEEIMICNVLELIPCTKKAIKNLKAYKTHAPI